MFFLIVDFLKNCIKSEFDTYQVRKDTLSSTPLIGLYFQGYQNVNVHIPRGLFKITMTIPLNICPYCRHILTLLRHDGWLSSAEFIKIHTTSGTHIIGIYS